MKQFFNAISFYVVYASVLLMSILPLSFLYLISSGAFFILYYIMRYRRAVVIQNFSRAFPEKRYEEVAQYNKLFYRQFIDYFVEIGKMFSATPHQIKKQVHFKNAHLIDDYTRNGKNVIIAVGHCGNWEKVITTPLAIVSKVYSAYKPLSNKTMDRLMLKIRTRYGLNLIPADSIAKHFLNESNTPSAYLFVADQCPKSNSRDTKYIFLNQETTVYQGIEKLSRKTNAAVVFFKIIQAKRGFYEIECIPIAENSKTDQIDITGTYLMLLEQNIREQPQSWLWTHKRWKR